MQDLPPVGADDEKAVQDTKRERWDGEEIHRRNGLAMVSEERQPSVRGIWISRSSPDPPRDAPFRIKLYRLSQAANPPPTTFVDVVDIVYDANITYDLRFFASLNRVVQAEPWMERDKAMIDQLKSIGIEKGKPFKPDANTQDILNDAAREAHAWLVARYEESLSSPYYEGGHWALPGSLELLEGQATFFAKPDVYPVDVRGVTFSCAYFTPKHLGTGSSYLLTIADKDGGLLDGGATYNLTVPANAPANHNWPALFYDPSTHPPIRYTRRPIPTSHITHLHHTTHTPH